MQLALTQMLVNLFYHNLCAETNSLNKEDYVMSMIKLLLQGTHHLTYPFGQSYKRSMIEI